MEYRGDVDEVVSLYRQHNGQPWGFRMMGGRDKGCCLYIAKVKRGSLAAKSGLHAGDAVLQIGPVPATHLNHEHAKAEILRAGNDLHLLVRRNAVQVPTEPEPESDRAQVVEEATKFRGEKDMKAQSRCFRIMTDALVDELNATGQSSSHTNKVVRFA